MAKSELVREGIGYLPTCFTGGHYATSPDETTLLIRCFRLTRGPSGKLYGHAKSDAIAFEKADLMAQWIEEHDAFELPDEAEGNLRYLPPEFDPKQIGTRS